MQMLRVIIYDALQTQAQSEVQHIGGRGLISVHSGRVDWEEQLDREMGDRVGKLLVSGQSLLFAPTLDTIRQCTKFIQVSAQVEVRERIRSLVRPRVYKEVELFETEFQPWGQIGGLRAFLKL
jgi:hypothetical protein